MLPKQRNTVQIIELFAKIYIKNGLHTPFLKFEIVDLKKTEFLDKAFSKKRKTKLGFDQIYVINLARRTDRRERIESALNDLNLSFNMTQAVDSRSLNEDYLRELNVNVVPNYVDPYHHRYYIYLY